MSCKTIFAMIGDNGELIGVPKICLYVQPPNLKKWNQELVEFLGIKVSAEIESYLFKILLTIKFNGVCE